MWNLYKNLDKDCGRFCFCNPFVELDEKGIATVEIREKQYEIDGGQDEPNREKENREKRYI
ncbi:MAG: hypothetical protein ACI4F9_12175 [Lachnospiraceae bacterium]